MTMPPAIVEAMERGAFVPLPDRSGFFVMLDTTNGLACPDCERAMAFVIVRQLVRLAGTHEEPAWWSYRCLGCADASSSAAVVA